MNSLFFVSIEANGGSYTCRLRETQFSKNYAEFSVRLGANDSVEIKGQSVSLGTLVKKLADYNQIELSQYFDDRGQLDLGRYLFDEIFRPLNQLEQTRLASASVEVRIVTTDEHVAKLPWCLLAHGEVFLTTEKWSVALSASADECTDCLLSPSPRLLFVTPQPRTWGKTEAPAHVAEVETLLCVANPLHTKDKHLRIVETWSDLTSALESFKPHIVYFYGHGTGDMNASRLVFSKTGGGDDLRPVADFANLLRSQGSDCPVMVYVNCCKGDVGGLLGVSFQLGSFIPAVITNCTTARIDAAREQARTVWRNILVNGVAPHEAVICMRRRVAEAHFSFSDIRWMTPVLRYRYKKWEFRAPANEARLQLKPNWDNLLDRTKQTAEVVFRVGSMLQAQKRPCLAILWHGQEGQGIEQFYHRVEIELQNRFHDVALYQVTPAWPQDLHNFHRSISDMLAEAFEVSGFEEISYKIRFEMLRKGAHRSVVFLRHPVLNSEVQMSDPNQLRNYLEWLDKNLASQMDPSTCLLVGCGFEQNNHSFLSQGTPFKREAFEALEDVEFTSLTFHILEELGKVERRDLLDFMRVQTYQLPVELRDKLITRIIERTGGQYQRVVEELKEAF